MQTKCYSLIFLLLEIKKPLFHFPKQVLATIRFAHIFHFIVHKFLCKSRWIARSFQSWNLVSPADREANILSINRFPIESLVQILKVKFQQDKMFK